MGLLKRVGLLSAVVGFARSERGRQLINDVKQKVSSRKR